MDDTPPPDLERLAQLARARRRELGLAITAVAARASLSKDTYAHVERGEPVRAATYAKVEPALDWAAGSIRDVLNGGEPTVALPVVAPPRISAAELRRALAGVLVETAADLTGTQIQESTRQLVAELARLGLFKAPEEGEGQWTTYATGS